MAYEPMPGFNRAQKQWEAMTPDDVPECDCDRWYCGECGNRWTFPGICCALPLYELDDAALADGSGDVWCGAHGLPDDPEPWED